MGADQGARATMSEEPKAIEPKPNKPKKPYLLMLIGWWMPIAAAVLGGAWTIIAYVDTQLLQARQPFLTKQLELYDETLKEVGKLVTLPRDHEEWVKSELRFWQLYWSELSMVESGGVEDRMVRFGSQLNIYKQTGSNIVMLKVCSYELAHGLRISIQERWQFTQSARETQHCPNQNNPTTAPIKVGPTPETKLNP